jgi:hypothetical protein
MKAHALLAAFILPVAVMFMTTGALYTWGVKGGHDKHVYEIPLSEALHPDLDALTSLLKTELTKLNLR